MNRFELIGKIKWPSLKAAPLDAPLYALPAFEGLSILTLAAKKKDVETLDAALTFGANPNTTDLTGHTPLMRAAIAGDLAICRSLLSAGADVNMSGLCGRTALMAAAYGGHVEIVRFLLDRGADPAIFDQDGNSAFDYGSAAPQKSAQRLREIIPVAAPSVDRPIGTSFASVFSQTRLITSFTWLGDCAMRIFLAIWLSFTPVMLIGLAVLVILQGNVTTAVVLIPLACAAGLTAVFTRQQIAAALDRALIGSIEMSHLPSHPASRIQDVIVRSWATRMSIMRAKAETILRIVSGISILTAILMYVGLALSLWSETGAGLVPAMIYANFALALALPIVWLSLVLIARPLLRRLRQNFLSGMLEDQSAEFRKIGDAIVKDRTAPAELGTFTLYLRSFGIDNRLKVEGDYLESMLALSVAGSSLLVCISRNSDYLGAVEITPSDAEWQAYVLKLASAANRIMFVPDATSGVVWEANMLQRENLLEKVLFLMPPTGLDDTKLDLKRRWSSMRTHPLFRNWEVPPYADPGGLFTLARNGTLASWAPLPTDLVRAGISRPLRR